MVDLAGTADISSIQSSSIPQADMLDAAALMQHDRAVMDASARRAQLRAPDEDEPSDVDEDSDGDGALQDGRLTGAGRAPAGVAQPRAAAIPLQVAGPNPNRARRSSGGGGR